MTKKIYAQTSIEIAKDRYISSETTILGFFFCPLRLMEKKRSMTGSIYNSTEMQVEFISQEKKNCSKFGILRKVWVET